MPESSPDERPDLTAALARGDTPALAEGLARGADADGRDRSGMPLLSHAAARGDEAAVRLLLDHGADPRLASDAGNTPLMAAATHGNPKVLHLLLKAGADPETTNRWGLGATDWAKWAKAPTEVRALLQDAGAGGPTAG